MSDLELKALKTELDKLIQKGYIRRSKSQYGHNVLFVKKGDGGLRMCIDYRPLNKITKKNMTPQISHTDVRHRVQGKKFFSKFDVKDAFFMIRMHEDSIDKTAFKTPFGLWEYLVCPFGATNSPPCFSTLMFVTFNDCDDFLINHMDDLLAFSSTWEEHLEHIKTVLSRLQQNRLHVKLSKCEFAVSRTTFCSMSISGEGLDLESHQKEALCQYPQITSVKEIQQFMGLVRFFADFCPWLADIAAPLFDLTRKDACFTSWNVNHQSRVRIIQFHLSNASTLHFFDPALQTFCATDASDFAIGGWLGQIDANGKERVITYWSRRLIAAERSYPVHERELLALVEFVKKFRIYLQGIDFEARVDHRSMEYLQSQPELSDRQIRWISVLQDFMPNIRYIKGPTNTFADWLSRRPDFRAILCPHCNHSISRIEGTVKSMQPIPLIDEEFSHQLCVSQLEDPLCIELQQWTDNTATIPRSKKAFFARFSKQNNLWTYFNAIIIPKDERARLMHFFHSRADRGHYGFRKTYAALRQVAYWRDMAEELQKFISDCDTCQFTKADDYKRQGLLHPLPIPDDRFLELSFDFKPLPRSTQGNDFAWVITDRLTKFIAVIPCKQTLTSEQGANLFYHQWYLRGYGFPAKIFSDRDPRFISQFWKDFGQLVGFESQLTTARHQQANGQAESSVKILTTALRQQANARQNNWEDVLSAILFAYNNSVHTTTGYTPYYLAFGFEPHTFPLIQCRRQNYTLHQSFTKHFNSLNSAHCNIQKAQERAKSSYDRHHYDQSYNVGDLVLLARAGIVLATDTLAPNSLLQPWIGPFPVTAYDSTRSNVVLKLPPSMRCHNEFHISHVRPWRQSGINLHNPTPTSPTDPSAFEVDSIVDFAYDGKTHEPFFRVRWVGYSRSHDTWEPISHLRNSHDAIALFLQQHPEVKFTLPPLSTGVVEARGGVVNPG
jgi:hypothetical protein